MQVQQCSRRVQGLVRWTGHHCAINVMALVNPKTKVHFEQARIFACAD